VSNVKPMDALKPYPEYKDSGSLWLGRVPQHWSVLPNRALFIEMNQRGYPDEEMLSVTINQGIIRQKALLTDSSKKDSSNQDKSAYKLVSPGDIAYNKMRAWQGAIGISDYCGIVSPAYIIMRLREAHNPRYFHQLFRTPYFAKEAERWSYGITSDQWSLRAEHFKMIYSLLPPREEQDAIVRFLDHANRQIDRYIRVKKRMIALLNEQKQAIIHQAVTRGLDPNVRLKPSGIPWLSDIPAHWEIVPLKSVCFIQSGITLGKNYLGESLAEYPYLRVANVQAGRLELGVVKRLRLPEVEAQRSLLLPGDVLMTEGGDPDKLGRGCVWEGQISPCLHQNHVFAVRPVPKRLLSYFLSALLSASYAKNYFLRTAKQTTNLASTNKTTIGQFRVLLPSIREQNAILQQLELDTKPVNEAITRTEREIALMNEYRTRLIADVVTGQLDVREAARHLPTIIEETADLTDIDGLGEEELTDLSNDGETDA
jgi:type I restriction enzyme S subunit